jgi:hypothetical protein
MHEREHQSIVEDRPLKRVIGKFLSLGGDETWLLASYWYLSIFLHSSLDDFSFPSLAFVVKSLHGCSIVYVEKTPSSGELTFKTLWDYS